MKHMLAGLAAVLLAGAALVAQQPPLTPTFRVQVDAVQIEAFVTDAQGKPVTGLTPEDFQIFEDGKPQVISSFSQIDIPFERRIEEVDLNNGVAPDVLSNERSDGRVYMFLLDELSPGVALRARGFIKRFLREHFAANDRGAVVFLGRQDPGAAQMFTNEPRLLAAAVDRYMGGFTSEDPPSTIVGIDENNPTAPTAAAPTDVSGVGTAAPPFTPATASVTAGGQVVDTPAARLTAANTRLVEGLARNKQVEADVVGFSNMAGLESAVNTMAGLRGRRKALMLFSAGLHPAIFRALTYGGGSMNKIEEAAHAAVTAATRGGVTIYAIDPAGLTTDVADAHSGAAPSQTSNPDSTENRMSLSMLADATGGFSLVNSSGFAAAFERIVRENSTYYMLGFSSSNEKRDGRHHSLQVRVMRPGLEVRAREGYVAPLKNERQPEPMRFTSVSPGLSSSLTNPLSDGTVPIRLFAAAYRQDGKNALVAISAEIDPGVLGLTEQAGVFMGELEVGFFANDLKGKLYQGEHNTVALRLRTESYNRARRQQSLRVLSEIRLPPGRYQLHFAAGNPAGKAGNVVYDLTVPDFRKKGIVLSGLALTSATTTSAATVAIKDPLRQFLPRPLTARREFDASDTLAVFGEAYHNVPASETSSMEVHVDLRGPAGRLVRTQVVHENRFLVQLPLMDLPAGPYVIHVDARTTSGPPQSVVRDIPIRVQ